MVDVKFCGLTRAADATVAASLGAAYAGVIFAGGPRERTTGEAQVVLEGAGSAVKRVGVFGEDFRDRVPSVVNSMALDVIQLHGDAGSDEVHEARRIFGGEVWAALRLTDDILPEDATSLFAEADAVLLEARVPGVLGGSGVTLRWDRIAAAVHASRAGGRLVLAGGLTPENVGTAVAALEPDVVDVSSGVESSPGIKDHARMEAFVRAVRGSAR